MKISELYLKFIYLETEMPVLILCFIELELNVELKELGLNSYKNAYLLLTREVKNKFKYPLSRALIYVSINGSKFNVVKDFQNQAKFNTG